MPLYHKDIFVPADIRLPAGKMLLEYSLHVRERCTRHKGKRIELPQVIDWAGCDFVEIETNNSGKVVKVLVRQEYDDNFDIILVINLANRLVKTTWLNMWNDQHRTLDTTKYEKGI